MLEWVPPVSPDAAGGAHPSEEPSVVAQVDHRVQVGVVGHPVLGDIADVALLPAEDLGNEIRCEAHEMTQGERLALPSRPAGQVATETGPVLGEWIPIEIGGEHGVGSSDHGFDSRPDRRPDRGGTRVGAPRAGRGVDRVVGDRGCLPRAPGQPVRNLVRRTPRSDRLCGVLRIWVGRYDPLGERRADRGGCGEDLCGHRYLHGERCDVAVTPGSSVQRRRLRAQWQIPHPGGHRTHLLCRLGGGAADASTRWAKMSAVPIPPDDRAPGDLDPEETRRRLESLFGEKLGEQPSPDAPAETPSPLARPPRNLPVTPPAQQRAQYHVAAPDTPGSGTGDAQPAGVAARSGGPAAQRNRRGAPPASTRSGPEPAPTERGSRRRRGRHGVPLPLPKAKWFRPKLRWFTLYLPLLVLLVVLGGGWWAWRTFDTIDRVDLGDALTPATGAVSNYLIVGSDSRANIGADDPDAAAFGPEVKGERADTLILMRVGDGAPTMMSVPRDLWVTNAATGRQGRVNGAIAKGRANLVRTVTGALDVTVQHYVEVDFVSFAGIVDAMGGITIDFPHPAFDRHSGLRIDKAGPNLLDGRQALAYVRSRHYTEIIDGKERTDPTGDLGRQQRQQTFIRTVLKSAGDTRNPITLARIAAAGGKGSKVDDTFGLMDAWRLVRGLSDGAPESLVLPTTPARKGGAAVLLMDQAAAPAVLARFRERADGT